MDGGYYILSVCSRCGKEHKRTFNPNEPINHVVGPLPEGWKEIAIRSLTGGGNAVSFETVKIICPECNEAVWQPIPQALPENLNLQDEEMMKAHGWTKISSGKQTPFNAPEVT